MNFNPGFATGVGAVDVNGNTQVTSMEVGSDSQWVWPGAASL